jgi:MSHA pilin protein MshC
MFINKPLSQSNGFTIIELIVVVLIISILALTVVPKFFGSNGYEEFIYQAETITKLRSIQFRAMQQTDGTQCHMVLITSSALGIPANCSDISGGWLSDTTSVVIQTGHEVSFDVSSGNVIFTFDSLGIPDCTNCLISITGDDTLKVAIESQGYIHEQ